MDKKKITRWVEALKSVLIVLLAVSAVYLAYRTLLMSGLEGFWSGRNQGASAEVGDQAQSETAWPVRIAVTGWTENNTARYGVQYDRETCDEQFRQVANLLREALGGLCEARQVDSSEWERALGVSGGAYPGQEAGGGQPYASLYFDLLGSVPLSVLSGWLSGEDSAPDIAVRRLILAADGEGAALYYRNEADGAQQLYAAVQNVTDNGAIFAFEQEQYAGLAGDTMILTSQPQPRIYSSANPLGQTEEGGRNNLLRELLTALSFPDSSSIYPGTDRDQVIRSGGDTLRISAGGVVSYKCTQGESSRYQVASEAARPTLYEAAEACRALADGTAGAMAGSARLYLRRAVQTQTGWEIEFGYCLDGAAVQVGDEGYAARFVVEGSEITQFVLQLRTYADTGERSAVLPEEQAMAAMAAMGCEGGELELAYRDVGAESVTAGWVTPPAATAQSKN